MLYEVDDQAIGHGDDVLQLFDAIASQYIGRHRQTEALVRGESEVDRQLVVDECALVLHGEGHSGPVLDAAKNVLWAIGIDPAGPIQRLDAGQPTVERLANRDRRREALERTRVQAGDVAATTLDAAADGIEKAKGWLRKRRGDGVDTSRDG